MAPKKNKRVFRIEKQDANGFGLVTQSHGNPPNPELVRMQWGPGEYRIRELNPETKRWRQCDTYIISGGGGEPMRPSQMPLDDANNSFSELLERLDAQAEQLEQLHAQQQANSKHTFERLAVLERSLTHSKSPQQQVLDAMTLVQNVGAQFAAKNPPDKADYDWGLIIQTALSGLMGLAQAPPQQQAPPKHVNPPPAAPQQRRPQHQRREKARQPPQQPPWAPPHGHAHQHHRPNQTHPYPPQHGWPHPQQSWASHQAPWPAPTSPESHPPYPSGHTDAPQQHRQNGTDAVTPPPLPSDQSEATPSKDTDDAQLRLHPTLPGMTAEIEDELFKYSEAMGIPWEQGIKQAQASGLNAPQLLAFARSRLGSKGGASHAAH